MDKEKQEPSKAAKVAGTVTMVVLASGGLAIFVTLVYKLVEKIISL